MKITKYAPVLIPTLNRHIHFKRCVESLARCTHAEKTDLFITLDYPLKETHWDGYEIIKAYVKQIGGFNTVNIIQREENYGPGKNIGEARKLIYEKYDRIILSEDDNEFSPNFLDYINKGLEFFWGDPNVLAICGYSFPVNSPTMDGSFYTYRSFSAWGCGTWRGRIPDLRVEPAELKKSLVSVKSVLRIYKRNKGSLITTIKFASSNKYIYGDMKLGYLMSINPSLYCVFPAISKVRNHGHDGSGEHCGLKITNNVFVSQNIDESKYFNLFVFDKAFNKKMNLSVKKYFNVSLLSRIKIWAHYVIYISSVLFHKTTK